MFGGAQVLIVEDEMLIAFDLADEVERAGGKVIGPFSSVGAALRALRSESVEGAILDANLADRDIAPVAIALINQGIPVIIHTGVGVPAEILRIAPDVPVWLKPTSVENVVAALGQMMERGNVPQDAG